MKTKITILVLFLASLTGFAQIKRNSSGINTNIKYSTATKLPLLKATKYQSISNTKVLDFGKRINTLTQLIEIPKPPAPGSTALNVILTPKTIRKNGTHLTFHGYHDGEALTIGREQHIRDSWLLLDYQSVKRKTYRVTVDLNADFNWSNKNVTASIFLSGANDRVTFKIKKGYNLIDFLVQANHTGKSRIFLFSTASILNGDRPIEGYYKFNINEVKIRQLQD